MAHVRWDAFSRKAEKSLRPSADAGAKTFTTEDTHSLRSGQAAEHRGRANLHERRHVDAEKNREGHSRGRLCHTSFAGVESVLHLEVAGEGAHSTSSGQALRSTQVLRFLSDCSFAKAMNVCLKARDSLCESLDTDTR
jgi:hypothetical protein